MAQRKAHVFEDPRVLARREDFGKMPDTTIARELDVPVDWIRKARMNLGIDAFARTDEGMRIRDLAR